MISKHAWIYWLVSQLFLLGVTIAGCESSSGGNDAGPQCAADEFFRYDDRLCGKVSSAGHCHAMTTGCDSVNLKCGCDGTVYQSVCEVHQAGVSTTSADQCTAPPGTFACGHTYCAKNTTYCHELDYEGSDSGDISCEPIPSECASAPSCECLVDWWSFDECESDGMGGLHATEFVYTE